MRAVKHVGPMKVEVVEIPDPQPEPGRVVVDLKRGGICGSDLHVVRREPRPTLPGIPGHEPCGVVSAVGAGVTHVKPGDRVTVYHYESCGLCQSCRCGDWMWCRERDQRIVGYDRPGSCAEKILIDARNCLLLPDELSFEDGAFIACGAGTTWSALRKARPSAEDTAAVIGLGPIGLLGVYFLKAFGARVIGVGRRKARVECAKDLGADMVVDIDETDDPAGAVKEVHPEGVSLVYETSGAVTAHRTVMSIAARYARVVAVGLGSREPSINLNEVLGKQLSVYGSFVMNAAEYDNLAHFMVRHKLDLSRLVSHRFPIEDAQSAFDMADAGECTKVMLTMNANGQE